MTGTPLPVGLLAPADQVLSTMVEDEVMLLAIETSQYVGLRGVATRIWALIEERAHSAEQIAQTLSHEFDAPVDTIRADLATTLASLSARHLITSG